MLFKRIAVRVCKQGFHGFTCQTSRISTRVAKASTATIVFLRSQQSAQSALRLSWQYTEKTHPHWQVPPEIPLICPIPSRLSMMSPSTSPSLEDIIRKRLAALGHFDPNGFDANGELLPCPSKVIHIS